MQHLFDRTLDGGLMDQLDLDFGDDGAFLPPSGRRPFDDEADDGGHPEDPHQIGRLQIAGRRYELDCRIDPVTQFVVGYALRLIPASAAA